MTPERAKLAAETLEDVFTPDGFAGVIAELRTREATRAKVVGRFGSQWFNVSKLKAKEEL